MAAPIKVDGYQRFGGVNVSGQHRSCTINVEADLVELPPTFAEEYRARAGANKWTLNGTFDMGNPDDENDLTAMFLEAIDSETKEIDVDVAYIPGGIGASVGAWSGTVIVTAADWGGDARSYGESSYSFRFKSAPVKTTIVITE